MALSPICISDPIAQVLKQWRNQQLEHDQDVEAVINKATDALRLSPDCMPLRPVEGAFLTLFVEAARHGSNPEQIAQFLVDQLGFQQDAVLDHIKIRYQHLAPRLEYYLLQTSSTHLPHLVDVQVQLQCEIVNTESGTADFDSALYYNVSFLVDDGHQADHGAMRRIDFVCSVVELQDLLSTLKDAKKHLEQCE